LLLQENAHVASSTMNAIKTIKTATMPDFCPRFAPCGA
jgi:hypothetical protein